MMYATFHLASCTQGIVCGYYRCDEMLSMDLETSTQLQHRDSSSLEIDTESPHRTEAPTWNQKNHNSTRTFVDR
ncbi:MAG: hypothetical protein VX844_07975 [SAR324 cluster bacterium]|nr:hypothetical protein [SAR324 cluster bacterium]